VSIKLFRNEFFSVRVGDLDTVAVLETVRDLDFPIPSGRSSMKLGCGEHRNVRLTL
jgi:hypothetical protein